jgi:hypothetical protein
MSRRWGMPAVVMAMGVSSAIAAQTVCDCGSRELVPVVMPPASSVRYTGGLGSSVSARASSRIVAAPITSAAYLAPAPYASSIPYVSSPATTAYQPLVPIVSAPPSYYVGRGVIGQPKMYVPGQPIRNFLRYLTP